MRNALALVTISVCSLYALPAAAGDGGWGDRRDNAVGMLLSSSGSLCSGTLIAPNVVLTAGHCIGGLQAFYTGRGNAIVPGSAPVAQLRQKLLHGMTRHNVVAEQRHTSYSAPNCPSPISNDVGVVKLAEPIHNIAPVHYGGASARKGATCDSIGYGTHLLKHHSASATTPADVGSKRRTEGKVTSVDATHIVLEWTRGVADHGDSGGPLYCGRDGSSDYIYGTVSRHCDGEGAAHRHEYYQNAHTVVSWIQGMVQSWAPAARTTGARSREAHK